MLVLLSSCSVQSSLPPAALSMITRKLAIGDEACWGQGQVANGTRYRVHIDYSVFLKTESRAMGGDRELEKTDE